MDSSELFDSIKAAYLNEAAKRGNTRFIKKEGNNWRIISAKTGKLWPQKYDTREAALDALNAYHASK